jgi:hypothetical protein
MKRRTALTIGAAAAAISSTTASAQLYVGIETGSAPPMQVSDLGGFPDVTWSDFHAIDVSGAAATPEGTIYVCNGAFTTNLYRILPGEAPEFACRIDKDMHALAYGRGKLYGYSNFAEPKGIYEIDPATGATTLVLDVYSGTGFLFFALDYNPVDDLLYGYTEYGDTGLYSINIDTGEMLKIADPYQASNTQGRGMAVGNNTVYVTATRGDDGVPYFAYDLAQGVNGEWVPFENPYPNDHATGGAAWVGVACPPDLNGDGQVNTLDFIAFLNGWTAGEDFADWNADGVINTQDFLAYLNDWVQGC